MEFNFEKFIKEYEYKETQILEERTRRERENPMCLNCSRYFPGCCVCEN